MKQHLEIKQGATLKLGWRYEQCDTQAPVDLTGAAVYMQFRTTYGSSDVVLEASTADGRITTAPEAGEIRVRIPADVTAGVTASTGVYDVEVHFQGGDVERLVEGTWTLSPEVTRIP